MNFCPNCGLDLKKIQGVIEKERETWRPWHEYIVPDATAGNETIFIDNVTNGNIMPKKWKIMFGNEVIWL